MGRKIGSVWAKYVGSLWYYFYFMKPWFLPRYNTTSNVMSVQFTTDGSGTGKGFRMHFKQTDFGCGGQVRLTELEPEEIIMVGFFYESESD